MLPSCVILFCQGDIHAAPPSQFIPTTEKNMTPRYFADFAINGIKTAGFNPIVKLIKDTPNQVIFEFRIESPQNQVQDELQMITKTTNGIYLLHYVIKKADMGQQTRDKWLGLLQRSRIK